MFSYFRYWIQFSVVRIFSPLKRQPIKPVRDGLIIIGSTFLIILAIALVAILYSMFKRLKGGQFVKDSKLFPDLVMKVSTLCI